MDSFEEKLLFLVFQHSHFSSAAKSGALPFLLQWGHVAES